MMQVTSDYSKFRVLKGNRDLKHVKRIIDSINEVGQMKIPIVINEKNEVIDGQHRLEAFKQLGLPVYYIVIPDAGLAEAIALNNFQKPWTQSDYLQSFVNLGNENYKRFVSLAEKHNVKSVNELTAIIYHQITTGGGNFSKKVRNGELILTEERKAEVEAILTIIDDLYSVITAIGGQRRIAITGIAWCLELGKTDKSRLIKSIKERYALIRPAADYRTFLEDLTTVYNKGARKNRIYFAVEFKEYRISTRKG